MIQSDRYLTYSRHNMTSDVITLTSFLPPIPVPVVSLHKYLLEKLDQHSDQCLIECETDISYGFHQLEMDSRRMASALRDMGLKEGDILGLFGENSYEYVTLYLAGLMAGAIVYGISSNDSFQEISDKIIQRNIKLFCISHKNISIAKRISEGIPIAQKIIVFNGGNKLNEKFELYSHLIDSNEPMSNDLISIPMDPKQSECLILSTSGSSGRPKPIAFTHYSVVSALEITSYPMVFGYTQSEVVSSHCEFAHQMSILQIFTSISTGSKIALMPKYEQKDFANYVKKYRISAAILTSSAIISLVKAPENSVEMPSLAKVISWGTVLSKTIANAFIKRYNHIKDLRQGLFQSECMAPIALMIKNSSEYESIGPPIPNTRVIIRDIDSGEKLSANQIGEICVQREDGLCQRYLNTRDDDKTPFDSDGWLHTRDLGFYDEDRLLYMIGAMDDMIRTGNTLISSTELEEFLLSLNVVSEAAVIAVPDEEVGQTAAGFVVIKPDFDLKVSDNEILDIVNNQLPKKKKFKFIYLLKTLPKTNCGKIMKRLLREELYYNINKQKF